MCFLQLVFEFNGHYDFVPLKWFNQMCFYCYKIRFQRLIFVLFFNFYQKNIFRF